MSSPVEGTPVGAQEAADLLHKLITESRKVQAAFYSPSSVLAFICGVLKTSPALVGKDRSVDVVENPDDPATPRRSFSPSLAVSCRYGDERVVKSNPTAFGFYKQNFTSSLTFLFPDGSVVALFEIADEPA